MVLRKDTVLVPFAFESGCPHLSKIYKILEGCSTYRFDGNSWEDM